MTIVYRSTKGSNLTPSEVDGNFTDLAARTDLAWSQIGSDPVVREGVANAATLANFRDGLYEYVYLHDELNESFLKFDVPFDYAVGTDLVVGIHWSPGSSTSTGNVRFGLEFTYAWAYGPGANSVFGPSQTVYITATQANGTAYAHYINFNDPASNFPAAGVQQNMRFLVRLFRDGTNVLDTFPDPIFVIGADFFYQTNKFGTSSKSPPF